MIERKREKEREKVYRVDVDAKGLNCDFPHFDLGLALGYAAVVLPLRVYVYL